MKGSDCITLYTACKNGDAKTAQALLASGSDPNASNELGWTSVHITCDISKSSTILNLLCAAGANLRIQTLYGYAPMDYLLDCSDEDKAVALACIRILIANGVRLSTVTFPRCMRSITDEMRSFEAGIIRCRSAVAVILKVKDLGRLFHWDRFLLAYIALQVWAAREEWGHYNFGIFRASAKWLFPLGRPSNGATL